MKNKVIISALQLGRDFVDYLQVTDQQHAEQYQENSQNDKVNQTK
jgi:hypothetical protein